MVSIQETEPEDKIDLSGITEGDLLKAGDYVHQFPVAKKFRRGKVKIAYLAACKQKNEEMESECKKFLEFIHSYINTNPEIISSQAWTVDDFYKLFKQCL